MVRILERAEKPVAKYSIADLPPDARAYASAMRTRQQKLHALDTAALKAAIKDVEKLRGRLTKGLGKVDPDDEDDRWQFYHLNALKAEAEDQIASFSAAVAASLEGQAASAFELGLQNPTTAHVEQLLDTVGATAAAVPMLFEHQIALAKQWRGTLIRDLGTTARRQVYGMLRQGIAGELSAFEIMQQMQAWLDTPDRPQERFGGLAYQAARILRTETARVFEMANEASMQHTVQQMGSAGGGAQKVWLHSGQSPANGARPRHVHLHGLMIPYDEDFVVDGWPADGPHDPRLPAKESINCRCTSALWHADWGEFPHTVPPGSDAAKGESPMHDEVLAKRAAAEPAPAPVPAGAKATASERAATAALNAGGPPAEADLLRMVEQGFAAAYADTPDMDLNHQLVALYDQGKEPAAALLAKAEKAGKLSKADADRLQKLLDAHVEKLELQLAAGSLAPGEIGTRALAAPAAAEPGPAPPSEADLTDAIKRALTASYGQEPALTTIFSLKKVLQDGGLDSPMVQPALRQAIEAELAGFDLSGLGPAKKAALASDPKGAQALGAELLAQNPGLGQQGAEQLASRVLQALETGADNAGVWTPELAAAMHELGGRFDLPGRPPSPEAVARAAAEPDPQALRPVDVDSSAFIAALSTALKDAGLPSDYETIEQIRGALAAGEPPDSIPQGGDVLGPLMAAMSSADPKAWKNLGSAALAAAPGFQRQLRGAYDERHGGIAPGDVDADLSQMLSVLMDDDMSFALMSGATSSELIDALSVVLIRAGHTGLPDQHGPRPYDPHTEVLFSSPQLNEDVKMSLKEASKLVVEAIQSGELGEWAEANMPAASLSRRIQVEHHPLGSFESLPPGMREKIQALAKPPAPPPLPGPDELPETSAADFAEGIAPTLKKMAKLSGSLHPEMISATVSTLLDGALKGEVPSPSVLQDKFGDLAPDVAKQLQTVAAKVAAEGGTPLPPTPKPKPKPAPKKKAKPVPKLVEMRMLVDAIAADYHAQGLPMDRAKAVAELDIDGADDAGLKELKKTYSAQMRKARKAWRDEQAKLDVRVETESGLFSKLEAQPKKPIRSEPDWPDDLTGLETVRVLGGSTGAELVRDADGRLFVMKRGADPAHVREEMRADALYRELGVRVPAFKQYRDAKGNPIKLAEFVEGQSLADVLASGDQKLIAKVKKQLQDDFAVDALLGNWDVAGLQADNVLVDADGKAWRIDNGGSLRKRAMGADKGAAWDEFPRELWSMRGTDWDMTPDGAAKQAADIFGDMTMRQMAEQLDRLSRQGAVIDDLKDRLGPELTRVLKARARNMTDLRHMIHEMELDGYEGAWIDEVAQARMDFRRQGVGSGMSKSLSPGERHEYRLEDESGRAFDDLRGSSGLTSKLGTWINGRTRGWSLVRQYAEEQGGDSWSGGAAALKYLQASVRGGRFGSYFWKQGLGSAKDYYDEMLEYYGGEAKMRRTWAMMQASNMEILEGMALPNVDRRRREIVALRTEDQDVMDQYGLERGVSHQKMERGALESASLVAPVTVYGDQLTIQSVPFHRLWFMYLYGTDSTLLHSDSENELVLDMEDVDLTYWEGAWSGRRFWKTRG